MEAEGSDEAARPVAKAGEHVAPTFGHDSFHCVWCGVLSAQDWVQTGIGGSLRIETGVYRQPIWRCTCTNCREVSWWRCIDEELTTGTMLFPAVSQGPLPHPDMPEDARADYNEARSIVGLSPRGAGALARLAAQKIVDALEHGDGTLDTKIGRMVRNGLDETIQQALDSLRVVGNNCVHDGEMVLDDDPETVIAVMECMNLVVEDRVARPSRVRRVYEKLPEGARAAIERRDTDT